MTQVKTLHFDNTGKDTDYLKVVYKNGDVRLLDTQVRDGVDAVLADLENGEFDDLAQYYPPDEQHHVDQWSVDHPKATQIYGE